MVDTNDSYVLQKCVVNGVHLARIISLHDVNIYPIRHILDLRYDVKNDVDLARMISYINVYPISLTLDRVNSGAAIEMSVFCSLFSALVMV